MKNIDEVSLIYVDEATNANKEYHLQLFKNIHGSYDVLAQWGRRGGTLQYGSKIMGVPLDKAQKVFDKTRDEKLGKGYVPDPDSAVNVIPVSVLGHEEPQTSKAPAQEPATIQEHVEGSFKRKIRVQWGEGTVGEAEVKEPRYIPQLLNPIDESEVEKYLLNDAWGGQEKKDGVHVQVKIINEPLYQNMKVFNKKGKEIPFIKEWLNEFSHACLLDGEKIGDYYHVFDILDLYTNSLRLSGYEERHEILSKLKFLSRFKIVPLAIGYKAKKELYDRLLKEDKEGIVFKRLNAIHTPGRPASYGDMLKFKFYSTASVRVAPGREGKRSIGMEVLDGNAWTFVGNCTIPPNKEIPEIGCVVEVRMLYYNKGGSIYQPTYLGLRDDTEPKECIISQLKCKPKLE
jgi:bifunctional non-homologous end joining protein LigD